MVIGLLFFVLDLLLALVEGGVRLALGWKDAALRLWNDRGAHRLVFEAIDFLLERLRALELYLGRVRARMRYRVFFEQLTAPMGERYRRLRRG